MNQKIELKDTLWTNQVISWVTAILIFLIAAGSFVLSYNNLHETAIARGIPERLAWIWPLLVDFALVVFSLAVVRASLYSEKTWWPWTLVGAYTLATIGFNIAHAPANLQAQIVAAIAPISLFLSFELLMGQLKNGVVRQGLQVGLGQLERELERIQAEVGLAKDELGQIKDDLQQTSGSLDSVRTEWVQVSDLVSQKVQELAGLESKADELMVQVERLTVQRNELKTELRQSEPKPMVAGQMNHPAGSFQGDTQELTDRQRQILDLLRGGNLTQEAMAGELGISLSTLKRELGKLNGLVEGAR